jgi:hypothetical protein
MRNAILAIAIAFVIAAPCTAFAGENSGSGSGRIGPDMIRHKHIGGVKYEDVQTQPKAPTTGTGLTKPKPTQGKTHK